MKTFGITSISMRKQFHALPKLFSLLSVMEDHAWAFSAIAKLLFVFISPKDKSLLRIFSLHHLLFSLSFQLNLQNFPNNDSNKSLPGSNLLQRHSINALLEQQDLMWSKGLASTTLDGK